MQAINKMDAKSKFQQLWAQFGATVMEEPLRGQEKRVEELVRENEKLRIEIASMKQESSTSHETSQDEISKLEDELNSLKAELSNEVYSGVARVEERNRALTQRDKEIRSLRQGIANRDAVWSDKRSEYKRKIKLLRFQLQWEIFAHGQLRKEVGILRDEDNSQADSSSDEGTDDETDAEIQRHLEGIYRASKEQRLALRGDRVEETPEEDRIIPGEDDSEDDLEGEYEGEQDDEQEEVGLLEIDEEASVTARVNGLTVTDKGTPAPRAAETEIPLGSDAPDATPGTRRSRRLQYIPDHGSDRVSLNTAEPTEEQPTVRETRKRARSEADVAQRPIILDNQRTHEVVDGSQSPADGRPSKRTRRQTERYTAALETTKNLAKIMTPPESSPPFLPNVIRRRHERAPAGRKSMPNLAGAAAIHSAEPTSNPRATASPVKSPRKNTAKTAAPAVTASPLKSPAATKSPRTTRSAAPLLTSNGGPAHLPHTVEFILTSGGKNGKQTIVEDEAVKPQIEALVDHAVATIKDAAKTTAFWRSYAFKRFLEREKSGKPILCCYTSQFPEGTDGVESLNPWKDGFGFACANCVKEGIACFTMTGRINNEKYEAVYKPPKRS